MWVSAFSSAHNITRGRTELTRAGLARGTQRSRWRLACAMAIALLSGACKSDRDRERDASLARLAAQIDRLRAADNAHKQPLLEQLFALECGDADACALKQLCSDAYVIHQTALERIRNLQRLAARDGGAAYDPSSIGLATGSIAGAIDEAQRGLDEAKPLMERCAAEQVRIVRQRLLVRG